MANTTQQTGPGKIAAFDDFTGGAEVLVAGTVEGPLAVGNGSFFVVGQGLAETDSGAVLVDALNGVLRMTATNEAEHACGLTTPLMFDVGLMGTIVAEARIAHTALVTRECFFGFSDVQTDLAILEGAIAHGVTTTFTLTASDIFGFWLSSELTASAEWHAIHNGGTATGVTDSTALDLDVDAVANEFDILRLEADTNGTGRWYINGVLVKTLAGAVSTSVNLALSLIIEEKVTGTATIDVDFMGFRANRHWEDDNA